MWDLESFELGGVNVLDSRHGIQGVGIRVQGSWFVRFWAEGLGFKVPAEAGFFFASPWPEPLCIGVVLQQR